MIPEPLDDLAGPLVRHAEPSCHLPVGTRVLTAETGAGEQRLQSVVVLARDALDELCDGPRKGQRRLGVDSCPQGLQVAPQEPLVLRGGRVSAEANRAGRIGPESQFQCFHGRNVLSQRIVEWTPFERFMSQDTETMPLKKKLTWKNEVRLVPTDGGTRLTIGMGNSEGPRLARKSITSVIAKSSSQFRGRLQAFPAAVEADSAEQQADAGGAPTVESIREAATNSLKIS